MIEFLRTNFLGWQLRSLSDPLAEMLCLCSVCSWPSGQPEIRTERIWGSPFLFFLFQDSLSSLWQLQLYFPALSVLFPWAQKTAVFPPASPPACITRPAPGPWQKNSINGELIFYNFFYFPPKSACSPVLSVPAFCYVHTVKSNSIITVNRNLTVMFKGKYYDALFGGEGQVLSSCVGFSILP